LVKLGPVAASKPKKIYLFELSPVELTPFDAEPLRLGEK